MRKLITALVFAIGSAAAAEAVPVTPLSLSDGAFTVQFASNPSPTGFVISNEIPFDHLKGNTLIELFEANNDLVISFSEPVTAASFDFALSIGAPGMLTFEAWLGGSLVSTGSGPGTVPPGFFNAEGVVAASAAGFDTLIVHSPDAAAFAIDNLWVTGAASHLFTFDTPEPLTLVVFGAGLIALARRRKAA